MLFLEENLKCDFCPAENVAYILILVVDIKHQILLVIVSYYV